MSMNTQKPNATLNAAVDAAWQAWNDTQHGDGPDGGSMQAAVEAALRVFVDHARDGEEWVSGHDMDIRVGYLVTEAVGFGLVP